MDAKKTPKGKPKPPTIIEVVTRFASEDTCISHLERIRWPRGLRCLRCNKATVSRLESEGKTGKERHLYHCSPCRYQWSVTTGTIFHDSHLPLTKWFLAIYLICSAKKGVSAKQLQRDLGVTYKTAWYMAHRIRLAMSEEPNLLAGVCEIDETYVGGKQSGKHGREPSKKVPVVGMKEKTSGKIRLQAVRDCSSTTLKDFIRKNAEAGTEFHTDEWKGYLWLDSSEFAHRTVNHSKEYVTRDGVHTNGCENVWSLFKRGIMGVYHKVSAKYLPLYLDEFAFRFNNRHEVDLMDKVLATCG